MSLTAMPFDGETYTAAFERSFTRQEISSGIYPKNILEASSPSAALGTSFHVEKTGDNTISISPGAAMLDGLRVVSDSTISLTIPKTSLYYDVVIEADFSNRTVSIKCQGRGSGTAAAAMQRSSLLYQICLATITMSGASGSRIIDSVTDTRLDVTLCSDGRPLCGLVSAIYQVDTSAMGDIINDGIPDGSIGASKLTSDISRVLGYIGGTEPMTNAGEEIKGWFIGDINQRNGVSIDFDEGELTLTKEQGEYSSVEVLSMPKNSVNYDIFSDRYSFVAGEKIDNARFFLARSDGTLVFSDPSYTEKTVQVPIVETQTVAGRPVITFEDKSAHVAVSFDLADNMLKVTDTTSGTLIRVYQLTEVSTSG